MKLILKVAAVIGLLILLAIVVNWTLSLDKQELNDLGTMVLGAAAIAGLFFLVVYSLLARWWESREGWYLFVSSAILAEILSYNYAAIKGWFLLTDPLVREWVRLLIYTQVLLVMAWRGLLVIQAQAESWRIRKAQQMDPSQKEHDASQ